MKIYSRLVLLVGIMLSACNLPSAGPSNGQVSTAAARTVQAVLSSSASTQSLATPTLDTHPAESPTPPFSKPMASVGDVVNCRSGPGVNFERVTQLVPETPLEIIGFFPPDYWIVSSPAGQCWISGEFTTPSGSVSAVPTVTAPPTSDTFSSAPEAPTFPKNAWTYYCYGTGKADITLSWNDKASNETGYRVLRNGEMIKELPPNSTYFEETINLSSGQSVSYQIQSYNPAGQANSSAASMACP